jgi:pimeloyl-ACP methyl ester carboxylesterase
VAGIDVLHDLTHPSAHRKQITPVGLNGNNRVFNCCSGGEMRVMNANVGIDYDVTGAGDPVILLHGFPDTRNLWRHQVSALESAGFQVITPDMRGYGRSDKPTEVSAYSMVNVVSDVIAVLDDLSLEGAHVVGHDWGAAAAWVTASFVPDRVKSLTALSVGHPTSFRSAGLDQYARSWYMLLFQFQGVAEEWLSANGWANFKTWSRHPDADDVVSRLEQDKSLTPALNWYRANVPPESFLAPPIVLPPIKAPVMGVWSSEDIALGETQMTRSASQVEGHWRYERLDGSGHWMQLETPDELNALLVDFLET